MINKIRNNPASAVPLALMIVWAGAYAAQTAYLAIRADFANHVAASVPAQPTEVDMAAACLTWSKEQGMEVDSVCAPFTDHQWSIMNGGRPIGDGEALADWYYHYAPDGTMILGPNRLRVWIPADRQTCPSIMVGAMVESMCPAWMDVENG